MPSFFNSGMATSARHVVGLQEPPRNTSNAFDSSRSFLSFADVSDC